MQGGININKFNPLNDYGQQVSIALDWSTINISWNERGTGNMGYFIPCFNQEMMPNQTIKLDQEIGFQFTQFVSTLFHEIGGTMYYYFVPYRLEDENWTNFIMGGVDGNNDYQQPYIDLALAKENSQLKDEGGNPTLVHTLLDYFEYPINNNFTPILDNDPQAVKALDYAIRAYNLVYNEHLRPIDLQPEPIDLTQIYVQKCFWEYDYFTNARVYQQRGNAPVVPLSKDLTLPHTIETVLGPLQYNTNGQGAFASSTTSPFANVANFPQNGDFSTPYTFESLNGTIIDGRTIYNPNLDTRTGDLSSLRAINTTQQIKDHDLNLAGVGFDLNDMYLAMGIMKVMMNNAKIKYRYIDFLEIRYGIKKQDARLQLPEYLGMTSFTVDITGIVQQSYGDTAQGQTPQGYIISQGTGYGNEKISYTAQEHGILIGIMTVKPQSVYEGGLMKQLQVRNRFEYPHPELTNMPDREILGAEIHYTQNNEKDRQNQGYTSIYNEYRTRVNTVKGLLRPSTPYGLPTYTLARYFDDVPTFNLEFVQCNPDTKRIKAYENQPDFFYMIKNRMTSQAPIPLMSDPTNPLNG